MSRELDSVQLKRKEHRKPKEKESKKGEKKRKQNAVEEVESGLTSPTKKRKADQRATSPAVQSNPIAATRVEPASPFYQQTSSFYLPLPPISQKHALQGICAEHISPLILTYYPPLHGVIISYANPRLSTDPQAEVSEPAYARSIDEYAACFVWFTAEFLVFKPQRNSMIEGYVNLQSESTIGLLCLNFFNASIERRRLPKDWRWIPGGMRFSGKRKLKKGGGETTLNSGRAEAEESDSVEQMLDDADGYFQDRVGKKIEGLLRFRVKNVDTSKSIDRESGFVSIEGTMLSEDEEAHLQEEEKERRSAIGMKQLARQNEPSHAMSGAIVNGFDSSMDIDDTPSSKHRARHGLPPVRVLWTLASAVRPPITTAANGITVSEFLEQINEVIPIESEDWGLEDYSVEVRGFECLHFQQLNQVLKEDDEVCIRPLQTQDLRFRKVSGRHQITTDGRHLIDGVAFGRPFLRQVDRPAIRIPSRKRRRITYDEDGDFDFTAPTNDRQIIVRSSFDDAGDVTVGDKTEDEDDLAPDDEEEDDDDLGLELIDLQNDLVGTGEADDGIGEDDIQPQRITRSRKSPKGLGLLRLVDDDGRPFAGQYNNPLLDFYGRDEAPNNPPKIRVRKRRNSELTKTSSEKLRSILRDSSASPQRVSRRDSAGSNRSVRFENAEPATPATIQYSEDSEDTDDGDFELSSGDESDKENAKPQNEDAASTDIFFEGSQSSSSTSSDDQLSEDETSSSGSSSSSSTSDSEPELQLTKDIVHKPDSSETSSSGSSISTSSDSEPGPATTGQKRKRAVSNYNAKTSSNEARPIVTASAPVTTAPGNGTRQTHSRNKRRRESRKLSFIKSKGILPATATKTDLQKFVEESAESDRRKMIADEGVRATFEKKREALLASIIGGGVDVSTGPSPEKRDGRTSEIHTRVGQPPSKAAGEDDLLMAGHLVSEENSRKPEPEKTSGDGPISSSTTAEVQHSTSSIPAKAKENPPTDTINSTVTAVLPAPDIASSAEATDSLTIDFQGRPDVTEPSNLSTTPTPELQHRRSKLDISSAKRMLFGSLGLRTPKTKDDEAEMREKLMKNVKPVREAHVEEKIETTEDVAAAAEDESWKDKIDLRAVECCYEGIQLSTPPFPFVQRWDPQQQRGYRMGSAKKRKGKKRNRHNDDSYEDNSLRAQVDVMHGNNDEYHDPSNQQSKELRLDGSDSYGQEPERRPSSQEGNTENHYAEHSHDEIVEDSIKANAQLRGETEDASAETLVEIEANDPTKDLPTLPEDVSCFPSLTLDKVAEGNIVAFKQLEMSAETNWQPKISGYRTAVVDDITSDGRLSMTLAKRDRSSKNIQYDEHTGERLYSKFEMPDYQDENREDQDGKLESSFDELINPLLVATSSGKDVQDAELQSREDTSRPTDSEQNIVTEEVRHMNSASKGFNLGGPLQDVSDKAAATSEETRQEISELIRDAGWRSSINHELTDRQEVNSGESKEKNEPLALLSPKFNGFSPSPDEYQVASSPPTAAVQSSGHQHATGSEIAESVSPQRPDHSPARSNVSNSRAAIDYPNLPQTNDDSEVFQQEAQDRSGYLEIDHQIDLTRTSSRSQSQGHSSSVLPKSEKSSPKAANVFDIADSDDSLPELFSQAFEKRMSQGRDIKPELSEEEYISPPSHRKSKRNRKVETFERESSRSWKPGSFKTDYGGGGESTPRPSQNGFSSQVIDLTISSDTVDPPDDSYADDDSYSLPKGSGWVQKLQKSRINKSNSGRTKKMTRG